MPLSRKDTVAAVIVTHNRVELLEASLRQVANQEGAEVAHSVEEALALAGGEVFVIGGAEVVALFLDRADRILTLEDGRIVKDESRPGAG